MILIIIGGLAVLLAKRMEGELPEMRLDMASPALGVQQNLNLHVADKKNGIRQVWVALFKDGKETVLFDKTYPPGGILSGGLIRDEAVEVSFDAKASGIKDGKAVLRLMTRDYAWRNWGKGNRFYQEQEIMIDTQPPAIEVLNHRLNIAQGGAGVVIYKLSEACPVSGVMVGDEFYPGESGQFSDKNIFMTFIALDYRQGADTRIFTTATDFAGNKGSGGVAYHINARRFKKDTIPISDRFLKWKMPEFTSQIPEGGGLSPVDFFLKVNRDLRKANYEALIKITSQSSNQLLWREGFLRLPRAANRAGFADHRDYTYNKKKIDNQIHLGIDLASLENSPVPAANTGKIVFAENLGIYGNTVVIDHGFGLFSMYAHLSHMDVNAGQAVNRGDIIGKTGMSGLAGGDHLHFSMLVYHTFVNPLEWWDPQWIRNNVQDNIAAIK
jgi:hypothetical protein